MKISPHSDHHNQMEPWKIFTMLFIGTTVECRLFKSPIIQSGPKWKKKLKPSNFFSFVGLVRSDGVETYSDRDFQVKDSNM